ncbi:hypothetical protein [Armatimonas sp.]|uniref:hypothetical protein n=1 Tax=Armatimonas sp. TaxID=1872638 RepID=UPI003752BD0A
MLQAQKSRSEEERAKRFREVLDKQTVLDAERELARFEPQTVLPLITRILQKEKQVQSQRLWIVGTLLVIVLIAYGLRSVLTRHLSGFFPFYIFFFGWSEKKKKGQFKHTEKLAQLLPPYIKQAGRSELGTLLELAGLVWKSPPLNSLLRDRLAMILPWTPTDELLLLTEAERSSLRLVTASAIEEFRDNAFYEPLAIAGLLALGTLGDQGVLKHAQGLTLRQTQGRVGAAAEEYLTQIAK